jgi:hypothetical protein
MVRVSPTAPFQIFESLEKSVCGLQLKEINKAMINGYEVVQNAAIFRILSSRIGP